MNDTDNSLFMDAVSMADGSSTGKPVEETGVPQRNYKDTVFRLLFNDREKLSAPTCRSGICSMWQDSTKS